MIVYTASGLTDGPHTVTLTNADAVRYLDLDYMIVNSTIQPGTNSGSGTNVTAGDSAGTQKEQGSNTGAIIGGAVAGAVGAMLLVLLAWLLFRRKRSRSQSAYMDKPPLDLTGDEIRPFRNSTTPPSEGPIALTPHPSAVTTTGSTYGRQPAGTAATESMVWTWTRGHLNTLSYDGPASTFFFPYFLSTLLRESTIASRRPLRSRPTTPRSINNIHSE